MPVGGSLELATPEVADFCRRWKVRELAVFGSALRADFGPDSDVDLLVTFEPGANWGLLGRLDKASFLTDIKTQAAVLHE